MNDGSSPRRPVVGGEALAQWAPRPPPAGVQLGKVDRVLRNVRWDGGDKSCYLLLLVVSIEPDENGIGWDGYILCWQEVRKRPGG